MTYRLEPHATLQLTITPAVTAKNSWDDLKPIFGLLKNDPLFQGDLSKLKKEIQDE
ncbi:MAG: hypothetical protein LBU04_05780 [Christensenellaceae bacterium]|jgi:hypothetical protein|nr:hypothetical protein [Christensenellaceae bacterium]